MENEEIDLKEIIHLFIEKRAIIYISLIIAILAGFVYTMYFKEPKYTASVTIILVQKDGASSDVSTVTQADVTLNDKLIATYKELAKSNSVVREIIDNLSLSNITEEQLKSEINVNVVKETQILEVSVTDEDPAKAQKIANELSSVFCDKVTEIYKIDNVNIVDKAELPQSPSNINHKKDIAIAGAIGVVISVVIILLINMLDTTVKSARDIEKVTGLIMLAEVPECNFEGKKLF